MSGAATVVFRFFVMGIVYWQSRDTVGPFSVGRFRNFGSLFTDIFGQVKSNCQLLFDECKPWEVALCEVVQLF